MTCMQAISCTDKCCKRAICANDSCWEGGGADEQGVCVRGEGGDGRAEPVADGTVPDGHPQ